MTRNFYTPSSTCKSCPFFDDYHDERGRGWCRAFDQPARQHHLRTPDCELVTCDHTVVVELHPKAVENDQGFYLERQRAIPDCLTHLGE